MQIQYAQGRVSEGVMAGSCAVCTMVFEGSEQMASIQIETILSKPSCSPIPRTNVRYLRLNKSGNSGNRDTRNTCFYKKAVGAIV